MTIFYQPETPPHKSLWTWRGTVFQMLLKKHTDMYVFFLLHAVFMAMRVSGYDMLGSTDAGLGARLQLPGLVVVFLVVLLQEVRRVHPHPPGPAVHSGNCDLPRLREPGGRERRPVSAGSASPGLLPAESPNALPDYPGPRAAERRRARGGKGLRRR